MLQAEVPVVKGLVGRSQNIRIVFGQILGVRSKD